MDFTDEEIGQVLGERLQDRADLASHARAELSKAPVILSLNNDPQKSALFLARICVLLQHVRSQLKYASVPDGWVVDARLRSIFMSSCVIKNPNTESCYIEELIRSAFVIAGTNAWLESQNVDEWRPGMRSGSGWVWKYSATPLGRQKVLRSDQPPQELVVAPKPAPKAPEPPPWSNPRANASAQATAIAAVKNEVSIAPHIIVNVHVPLAPVSAPAPAPKTERDEEGRKKKDRTSNGSNDPKEPSRGACLAAAQYQMAIDEHFSQWPDKPPSVDAVYAWLENNLRPEDSKKLPKKGSWARQLRNFRKAAGTQKKHDSRGQKRNG